MTDLLLFMLASVGMTNIIVDSRLFEPVRNLLRTILPSFIYSIFECHQCMGFWCGILCGLMLISFNPFVVLACGCASSFLGISAYIVTEFVMSKTMYFDPHHDDEDFDDEDDEDF